MSDQSCEVCFNPLPEPMPEHCPHCGAHLLLRPVEEERLPYVVLTTTPTLPGYRIERVLDIISAECAYGMNIFRDFFAGVRDIVGGRSGATQKVLRDARRTCLNELRSEARALGANAVIGVRLDYSEFSGGGKSTLFLAATGTAVIAEQIETPTG